VTIVAALAVLFGAYLIIDGRLTLSGAASDDTERIVDGSLQSASGFSPSSSSLDPRGCESGHGSCS
jgi:hypothetical protein